MDNLPYLVWDKLVKYLDFETRQICRKVSRQFKDEIDYVGHSITIGENNESNRKYFGWNKIPVHFRVSDVAIQYFLSKTKIQEIKIHDLATEGIFLSNHLARLSSAIVLGQIQPRWFYTILGQECQNLTKLFLGGSFLYAQDFAPHNMQAQRYVECEFKYLKELQISCSESKMYSYILFNNIGNIEMEVRVQGNLAYLLRVIRSQQLQRFYCRVHAPSFISAVPSIWIYKRLYKFIALHYLTLKHIYFPGLNHTTKPYRTATEKVRFRNKIMRLNIPKDLKSLQIDISERGPGGYSLYWRRILSSQRRLEEISWDHIQVSIITVTRLRIILKKIIHTNYKTLKYIDLTFVENETDPDKLNVIDCKLFETCVNLKVLNLESRGRQHGENYQLYITNLNILPITLVELRVWGIKTSKDFNGITFMDQFKNLEILELDTIGCKGIFQVYSLTMEFLNKVLRHRALNKFYLKYDNLLPKGWKTTNFYNNGMFSEVQVSHQFQYIYGLQTISLVKANLANVKKTKKYSLLNHRVSLFSMQHDPNEYFNPLEEWNELEEISHFMDLNTKHFYYDSTLRVHPFVLDLENYSSFLVMRNKKSSQVKILPNYMSTTKRIDTVKKMKVITTFMVANPPNMIYADQCEYGPVKRSEAEEFVNECILEAL